MDEMRRGLARVPLALLLTAVVEIAAFLLVGKTIGFGATVLLVLAASLLGMFLMRREGVRAWRRFRAAAQAGRPPGEHVTDGLVGLAAALLLALPGLVTAAVGLLLTVPPVRRFTRARVQDAAERRVSSAVAGDLFGPRRVRVRRGAPRTADGDTSAAAPPEPPPGGPQPVLEGEIIEPRRA
jgi:UPF0716 protein FxsA